MKMRQWLSIISMLLALVMVCAAFASCGIAEILDNLKNDDESETEEDESQDEGTVKIKSADEIKASFGDSFLVTYKITTSADEETEENSFTVARHEDYTYTRFAEESEVLQKQIGGKPYLYVKDESGKYNSLTTYPDGTDPFSGLISYLTAGLEELNFTSKSSESFLGRPCTRYEYKIAASAVSNGIVSVNYTEVWYIDNATGACLKHTFSGSASGAEGSASASAQYEATEFKTGADVNGFFET